MALVTVEALVFLECFLREAVKSEGCFQDAESPPALEFSSPSRCGVRVIVASQLREGMALRIDKQTYKVLEAEFKAGAGQAGGMVKAKLRNAASGRVWEPHFRPDERREDLELDTSRCSGCNNVTLI